MSLPIAIQPLVRRAILDLILDVGGELNDDVITIMLAELGHRVARSDVANELTWLRDVGLVRLEQSGNYVVAASTSDGRDVALGRLRYDGVSRHKTGE